MEMFKYVPVNNAGDNSHVKKNDYTKKCEQFFALLHEMFDFLPKEHSDLKNKKVRYPQFDKKMNCIATIGNRLNNEECREAIEKGYELYVTTNKWYNEHQS